MTMTNDAVTLTFPRSAIRDVLSLSASLTDHMHDLLERNTEGTLSEAEREELETLVQMAHFGQMLSAALQQSSKP